MKKAIIGYGGFGKEVFWSMDSIDRDNIKFFVSDEYVDNQNERVLSLSKFDPYEYKVVVAVANPKDRENIVNSLPTETKFFTHIHDSVIILGDDVQIGEGSIICAGTIITSNVILGKHTHLNLHTTIGHDCTIGDYFTTAPGVKISGNCEIGNRVYFGSNSSIKQKIKICDDVTIGLNGGVVKHILEYGVYGGVPVKKIK